MNSQYHVPSRKKINSYLASAYQECKAEVVEEMSGKTVAITTDLWTNLKMKPFITLTCHFLTAEWELKTKVVATRAIDERHTGVNIAQHVTDIAAEFGLDAISALVTDNVSNMKVAAKEAKLEHMFCFSHSLQLDITDALKEPNIAKVLAAARRCVSHFDGSTVATQALHDHQKKKICVKPRMLIQEVATRRNSTYQTLMRLLHLCVSVMAVLYDESITKAKDRASLVFDDAMWSVMEGAAEVLKPLAQATEILTKEKIPTSSNIYTVLKHILTRLHVGQGSQGLQEMDGRDADVLTTLKARIVQGMMTRFQVNNSGVLTTEPGLWSLAAILDPRYKRLSFFPYAMRERIEDYLKEQLLRDSISEQDATHEQESSNISLTQEPVEPQTAESLFDCIQGDIAQSPSSRPYASIELELEAYLSEPISTFKRTNFRG
ncbi:E3 SUMO-protein ligase ZBED1-like [Tachypleus tridentatus]|uniref:E3 SUMO-protein ligase ZBED1-like n=1 Tax=Tachypleus tridentatus TaxID=6853 RepID=UPI003FD299FB